MVQHPAVADVSKALWSFASPSQVFLEKLPQLVGIPFGDLALRFADGTVLGLLNRRSGKCDVAPPADTLVRHSPPCSCFSTEPSFPQSRSVPFLKRPALPFSDILQSRKISNFAAPIFCFSTSPHSPEGFPFLFCPAVLLASCTHICLGNSREYERAAREIKTYSHCSRPAC